MYARKIGTMPEIMTPVPNAPPPPDKRPYARYDWTNHADGVFHQWRDAPADEPADQAQKACDRVRLAARNWAVRRGGHIETRWINHGRQLWIAIHLPGQDAQKQVD